MSRLVVVGDSLLDAYYEVRETEWDAGIDAQAYRIGQVECCLGGAANVAAGVLASGGDASLYSLVGADVPGRRLQELMKAWRIDSRHVTVSAGYATRVLNRFSTVKSRLPLRLDYRGYLPMRPAHDGNTDDFEWRIDIGSISDSDGVIVADYGDILTRDIARALISECNHTGVPILVDPSRSQLEWYRGCTGVKLNLREVELLWGDEFGSEDRLLSVAQELRTACDAQFAIITLGGRGAIAVEENGAAIVPSTVDSTRVRNTTGAGDAFSAGFMHAFCSGLGLLQSADEASRVASAAIMTDCTCPIKRV